MGNANSNADGVLDGSGLTKEGGKTSADKKVKKVLKQKQRENAAIIKLLLLGAGESGKTTVLKQMTLLHGGGFSMKYKQDMKPKIFFNLIEGAYAVIKATDKLKLPLTDPSGIDAANFIVAKHDSVMGNSAQMDQELADKILLLTKDENVKKVLEHRTEFQVQESWDEYVKRLDKFPVWGGDDWLPDDEDILLSRVRTTGIVDETFNIDGVDFKMIDVGGQRSERRKWMGLFRGVTGVIFVASLSGYDQVLFEHAGTNRLNEAVDLWGKHVNKPDFKGCAMLLFLNKFDLFQQKYYHNHVPIKYSGAFVTEENQHPPTWDQEEDEQCALAIAWYKKLFLHQVDKDRLTSTFIHVTTALDPSNMRTVIDACSAYVLQQNMKRSGLVPSFH